MSCKVWAHRGASAYAPENTIPAFRMAMEMGADGIELDVQLSSDGKLMVIHDATVNRTSNGSGRVVDMTCQELKKLDFSNGMAEYKDARNDAPYSESYRQICSGGAKMWNIPDAFG